jgi:Ser/Thr protein kinase RdoA (MazF antagonist)
MPLDPRGQPWLLETETWKGVLRRFSPEVYPPDANLEHIAWVHRFLDDLAPSHFPAPKPLAILNGASMAIADGAIWEVLSFLPGSALGFDPRVPIESAGAMLARFHEVSLAISPADQRPGALPMEDCRPVSVERIADSFQRDLADLDHLTARRCVVHGDCTAANMLVDDRAPRVSAMIDFTLAHLGPPESDISFALWVTGRTEQPARTLDAGRIRAFVAGYRRIRPLTDWAARAIPLYLVGRGLQMFVRMERFGVRDEIQLARVQWLHEHRAWLEEVVASVI